jgi:hypothetical protein
LAGFRENRVYNFGHRIFLASFLQLWFMSGAVPTPDWWRSLQQYTERKFGKKIVFFDVPSVATLRAVKIRYFENV